MVVQCDKRRGIPSRHQNVSGDTILLYTNSIGNSVCTEYTIQKERTSYPAYYTWVTFIVLFSLCTVLNSVLGIVTVAAAFLIVILNTLWQIEKEVLLVTVQVGLQFTSFYYSGQQTTCFIPWHCMKDVYIVEAISFHRVLYNLVLLTESENHSRAPNNLSKNLIPLFQGIKPRLSCLESIYQSIHSLLPKQDIQ